jgi:hypothetical protein
LAKPDISVHLKVLSSSDEKQNGRLFGLQVLQFLMICAFEYTWLSYLRTKSMAVQVHLMHLYVVQNKHDFALKLKFELLANSLQVESRKCQNIANIDIHIVTYTLVGNLLERICVLLGQLKIHHIFGWQLVGRQV